MIKVTICLPTYNGAQYLEECLDAVLRQTYTCTEILIVDDGSTDATMLIASRYSKIDNRIRLIRNDHNLGLVENWNRCIELARGDWIKFVFQDDLIKPECLARMLAAADESGLPFVVCDRDLIFEPGLDLETLRIYELNPMFCKFFPAGGAITAQQFTAAVLDNLKVNFVGEPTSTLFRRALWQRHGPFNAALIQLVDLEYWVRLGSSTGVHFLCERLVSFRVHATSTSEANRAGSEYYTELDRVKLLYNYVFQPCYNSLRRVARKQGVAGRLFDMLVESARGTRWLAIQNARRAGKSDPILLHHWEGVLADYPRLGPLLDSKLRAGLYRLGYRLGA